MMVVVMYDISTKDAAGRSRLRRMEKLCSDHGVPVQKSVFEVETDAGGFDSFCKMVERIICGSDNVRYYLLGNHYKNRIVNAGKKLIKWDRENYII